LKQSFSNLRFVLAILHGFKCYWNICIDCCAFASKRYQVPRRGTVQLTLFNPQGTVVKMFVILFDLEEMPPNSKTFLRQRTYFMPAHLTDASPQAAKWLRYLIHLR